MNKEKYTEGDLIISQAEQIKYLEKELKYQKELGYNQLLGELDHIRAVEIPHMESEYQHALYLLKEILPYVRDDYESDELAEAQYIVDNRYIEPNREISSDEMPF